MTAKEIHIKRRIKQIRITSVSFLLISISVMVVGVIVLIWNDSSIGGNIFDTGLVIWVCWFGVNSICQNLIKRFKKDLKSIQGRACVNEDIRKSFKERLKQEGNKKETSSYGST